MSPFMLISKAALRSFSIVCVLLKLQLALGLGHRSIAHFLRHGEDDAPPFWEGLCKASIIPHGYKCQEFNVTGKDGYITGLQRIPEGLSGVGVGVSKNKPPVLVQHGILTDGVSWLMGSVEQSLVLTLADNGFDVWIANTRGTRFSKGHVTLAERNPQFWNFSWDDVAENDIPAIIEFIYKQTGQKINYVGHSMGTTVLMAPLSEGKLPLDKLNSVSLLSPIAYLNRMTDLGGIIASDVFLGEFGELIGVPYVDPGKILDAVKFSPYGRVTTTIMNRVARRLGIDLANAMAKIESENCCLNSSAYKFYKDHGFQPSSTRTLIHFSQTFRNVGMKKYDFGSKEQNMKHYGKPEPPVYDLKNIPKDLPMFLSYGGNDDLSDVNDVNLLLKDLSSHDKDKIMTHFVPEYAHLDFVFATNCREKAYLPMIDFIRKHLLAPLNNNNNNNNINNNNNKGPARGGGAVAGGGSEGSMNAGFQFSSSQQIIGN